ncbi:MAG: lytic murein transglycosylase [Magnetococcales bacterium]|nr:lytic murein transglycosylase [Magnetococcales bacterium]
MVDKPLQDVPGSPSGQGLADPLPWGGDRRDFLALAGQGGVGLAALALGLSGGVGGVAGAAERDLVARYPWLLALVDEDGFDRSWLNDLLGGLPPYGRVLKLMDHQAEALPYHKYRKRLINDRRVNRGRKRMEEERALLKKIESRYGTPAEILVALWGVESDFGRNMGRHPVLRSLFTLATRYPRRAAFFQEQLRAFLLLCREEGWHPLTLKGSFAGAMGQVQMIPSSMRRYAVDFDGDGDKNIFKSRADVLGSIANYLHGHGWQRGGAYSWSVQKNPALEGMLSPNLSAMYPWKSWQEKGVRLVSGNAQPDLEAPAALIRLEELHGYRYYMVFENFRVITRWNRSSRFAMAVYELSRRFGRNP